MSLLRNVSLIMTHLKKMLQESVHLCTEFWIQPYVMKGLWHMTQCTRLCSNFQISRRFLVLHLHTSTHRTFQLFTGGCGKFPHHLKHISNFPDLHEKLKIPPHLHKGMLAIAHAHECHQNTQPILQKLRMLPYLPKIP